MKTVIFLTLLFSTTLFSAVPDFEMSMGKDYDINQFEFARLYKQSYDKYNYENSPIQSKAPPIPKIIHHIWIGSPLPKIFVEYVESWKKHHPDWEFRLWTDVDIESFEMINKELFDRAPNYGMKSDIWRYEILERMGGLYVDTDFFCIKPFDPFHHTCEFYVGVMLGDQINNALIGSIPHHPILKTCIRQLSKTKGLLEHGKTLAISGPIFFSIIIQNALSADIDGIAIYPSSFFYPMDYKLGAEVWKEGSADKDLWFQQIRKDCFAIHLHAFSWGARIFKSIRS